MNTNLESSDTQVVTRADMLKAWNDEATIWAETAVKTYLGHEGVPQTTAGVLAHLDTLAAPAGYELQRHDYARRYHWVRRLLSKLVTRGALETSMATNSRQRACLAYGLPNANAPRQTSPRRRMKRSSYDIVLEGSPEVKQKMADFLEEYRSDIQGVIAIRIEE